MHAPSRRSVLAVAAVLSLALSAVPAFAGTARTSHASAKPKVVVLKAGVKSLPKSVSIGKVVTIDPRATTVPKGDGVTSFTIIYGDGATLKHKGGLTPSKHAYKKAGSYKVTLVVTDKHKKTVRTTVKLVVTAPKKVVPIPTSNTTTPTTATPTTTPTTAPPAPVVTPDPTGPLSGIIKHNGVGVSGLLVVAVSQAQNSNTAMPEFRTTSGSDGAYALQTPAGNYLIYIDIDPDTVAGAPDTAYSAEVISATVAPGGSTTVPVSIDAAVAVTGVVQDTRGSAAPSTVELDQFIGDADLEVVVPTSSTGGYSISGASDTSNSAVTNGDSTDVTTLFFTPNSNYLQYGDAEPDLTSFGGKTASQAPQLLADASAVSGTLSTPAGGIASNIDVDALDSNGDPAGEAVTDANGAYLIGHLPAGTYSVVADDPITYYTGDYNPAYAYNVPLSAKTTIPAKTPVAVGKATLRTPGTITGIVRDAAGVVPGAFVNVTTSDNVIFFASTDSSGKYSLPGLPASTDAYTVNGQGGDGESGSTSASVTAGGSTAANIMIS